VNVETSRDHLSDEFVEITRADDRLLESFWLPLYRRAFPDQERVADEQHRAAAVAQAQHVLVGLDHGRPVSMARYDILAGGPGPSFAYLMYIAVVEDAVSGGHGRQMFSAIIRRASADPITPTFLLFEVERPGLAVANEPYQSAERRIDFYTRQGSYFLNGVDYVQRLPGQPGVPMLIMVRPLAGDVSPGSALAAAVSLFGDNVRRVGNPSLSPAMDHAPS